MFLTGDADDNFVQVPDIIATRLLATQTPSVIRSEFQSPSVDGLIGNDNAAFQQHFLDRAQAERKAKVGGQQWSAL